MEMSNKRVYNLRSLPGERRGASGADARCHSMRTIGGEELSKRAPTEKTATAGRSELNRRAHYVEATADSTGDDTISLFSSIPSTRPSYVTRKSVSLSTTSTLDSVVQEVNLDSKPAPTTSASSTRRRWTPEMNKFILRTYLQLTALDTDRKTYLEPLHIKFIEKYPNMQVSRQRIGDQRTAIINNKLLPQKTIEEIRNDVKEELDRLQLNHSTQQSHNSNDHVQQILTLTQSIQMQPRTPETHSTKNRTQTRMRWTSELNEAIMRSYYRVTDLGRNETAYRRRMYEDFINRFPALAHLNEQRIADQRRAIVNNNYVTSDRLNSLKLEVSEELRLHNFNYTNFTSETTLVNPNRNSNYETQFINSIDISSTQEPSLTLNHTEINIAEEIQPNPQANLDRDPLIDETFQQAFQYFKETSPTKRLFIPKQKPSKKLARIVTYLNKIILPENVNKETDFYTLQTTIYCAAWTAAKVNGAKITLQPREVTQRAKKEYKPNWETRLERKLNDLRSKIAQMTQFINGNRSRKIIKHVNKILEQYRIHTAHEEPNKQAAHTLDTLKQKLSVVAGRLQRYKACAQRKLQNIQFTHNEKLFYRNIRQATSNVQDNNPDHNYPDSETLQNFWAGIWEQPIEHNAQAEWIQTELTNSNTNIQAMTFDHISPVIFHKVLSRLHNWKAPGSDNIHSYWYKKFTSSHSFLYNYINIFIQDPKTIPSYVTSGTTFMIPKDRNDLSNPAKYRPITCLQTLYKIITSCISELIYQHIDTNNILAEQQKGCRKFSQGCKEQLIIDSVILQKVQKSKTDLFSMYIDYKKAYDSVPHSWLVKVLEIYKIHPTIVTFLKVMMTTWTTVLRLTSPSKIVETIPIKIQRGIFQGDALSPLWFCLALNPLSNILNATTLGIPLKNTTTEGQNEIQTLELNHLLYMDDIKLYAKSETQLCELANLTEQFSNDIKMEFGIDKCKINSIRAGQNYQHQYTLRTGEQIEPLEEQDSYKYLGYTQSQQIHYKETKQKLTLQFQHRLNTILKTQLYSRNTIKAINTFAIPVLTYSFGIINWTKTDLKNLQRKINTTMTKFRKHHPRSCLQRLTLPRKEGGRGLIDILNLHNRQIKALRQFFFSKTESSILHKIISQNDQNLTPLNLKDTTEQKNEKVIEDKTKLLEWTQKSLHGRHRQDLCQINVDKEASNAWLNRGELFPETEGFMLAIQDQVVETKNYRKFIIKNLSNDTCRKCYSSPETIQHITGACKSITQTDYKHRHDQVANIIHQKLAHQYKLIDSVTPYYKYNPEIVLENPSTKLYFDRAILTDRTIHFNRPDITLINKINKTGYLIDIAIPNTHNLQTTIAEKLSKYTELKDEVARLWHLQKVTIVPIVLSTTGVIPKQLQQSLNSLNLPTNIYHLLQKAAILNTCRLVRKFLQCEPENPDQNTNTPPFSVQSSTVFNPTDNHLA
ncbi:unnamed protein product [Parnassius mnemosyne]|uniref:Reverse transcriptase domain-containing protein n=1 Tax=Parnassius mnemosyne TaxID=213953 RepID=A0AAV1KIT9_9NEOP